MAGAGGVAGELPNHSLILDVTFSVPIGDVTASISIGAQFNNDYHFQDLTYGGTNVNATLDIKLYDNPRGSGSIKLEGGYNCDIGAPTGKIRIELWGPGEKKENPAIRF